MTNITVGFTGTRRGMTRHQKQEVKNALIERRASTLFHGDATGADSDADAIAKALGIPRVAIPGTTPQGGFKDRAYCDAEAVLEARPFLERNKLIVDVCDILIATPAEMEMIWRSGTWSTIRHAIRTKKSVLVILRTGDSFFASMEDYPEMEVGQRGR